MSRKWLPFLAVAVFILVMGWLTSGYDLVYDSRELLTHHPVITGAVPLTQAFFRPYLDQLDDRGLKTYYRPLPVLSFALGRAVWGVNPGIERTVNLGLFLLWLVLVYFLVYRREQSHPLASMVMLFCALFPLNWDNVIWVAGRPDMLMLVFGTAVLCILEKDTGNVAGNRIIAVIFYGLALLSKESAFFLLPLLVMPMGRRREPGWAVRAGFTFMAVAVWSLRYAATGFFGVPSAQDLTLGSAIINVVGAAGLYARCLLFPFGVTPYISPEWVPGWVESALGAFMIGIMMWLIYRAYTRPPERLAIALFLTFFGGHLAAVFSDLYLFLAPRFMVVPFLGAAWWGLKTTGDYHHIRRFVVPALLLIYIPFVPLQVSAYKDNTQYWVSMHQAHPGSAHFSSQLAREYINAGRFLDAEAVLARVQPETARDFHDLQLLLAHVDLARADYASMQRRLNVLDSEPLDETGMAAVSRMRARMLLMKGQDDEAFAEMDELIRKEFRKDCVLDYHRMLLGRQKWKRARDLESLLRFRGVAVVLNAEKTARRFFDMSVAERVQFSIRNWNPREALSLLEKMPKTEQRILMQAAMLYFSGEPHKATLILNDWVQTGGREKVVADWYLKEMQRPREALTWYERDRKRNGTQPETLGMITQLEAWLDSATPSGGEK